MIRHRRFQNQIAESVFTLPVFIILSLLFCWGKELTVDFNSAMGLALTLLVAYVLAETNNTQQLIRIRTRMMASVLLLLSTSFTFFHSAVAPLYCALALSVSLFLLFRCYQMPNAVNGVFHSFLVLSLGSLCWIPMLCFIPFYYIYMATFLRCLSWRTFMSGIIGVIFPYWLWFGYAFWTNDFSAMQSHFGTIAQMDIVPLFLSESNMPVPRPYVISWLVVSFFALWSLVYYLRYNYNDKIRVRMMLYIYVCQTQFLFFSILLVPQYFVFLMALYSATVSSLIAHYFSLTRSRFSNFLFILFLLSCIAMLLINSQQV